MGLYLSPPEAFVYQGQKLGKSLHPVPFLDSSKPKYLSYCEFERCTLSRGFQLVLVVRSPPASAGDASSILGLEDPLEEGMATHSSILAWRATVHRVTDLSGLARMRAHRGN